jgi:hypothetical protein
MNGKGGAEFGHEALSLKVKRSRRW